MEMAGELDRECAVDDRDGLRDALGFEASSEDGFQRRATAAASVEVQHDDILFVLNDLERKIDKLVGSISSIDALAQQVRQLNDDVIHLERKLIGLR